MAYKRPGIYVEETLSPIPLATANPSVSIASFIGFAEKGPTEATLITSWSQYTSVYGSSFNYDLTTAIYLFFANGGNIAYVVRAVPATGNAAATRTFADRTSGSPVDTLTLDAKSVGTWGNNIYVTITDTPGQTGRFDLAVYYGGVTADKVVERFTELTMDTAEDRYAVTVLNIASNYVTATDESPSDTFQNTDNPAVVSSPTALAAGALGSTATTDLTNATAQLDGITSALVLNVPGVTTSTDVNALINYAEGRKDVFVVIDGIDDTVSGQTTLASQYTPSSYAAVYYPKLVIKDPKSATPGATIEAWNGAAVVGKIVTTDYARGVFKSPAGLDARISGAVSVTKLSTTDLDNLNSNPAPVNAIRYIPGSGIVIMGARTLKAGYADRYVSVRRSLIFLNKSLTDLTGFAIFEPNDSRLWGTITSSIENFLTDFWQQGGLRGQNPQEAFFVKCDEENNPSSLTQNGEVHIEVGVALQRPAEFVVIRISQFDSGAVVTVS